MRHVGRRPVARSGPRKAIAAMTGASGLRARARKLRKSWTRTRAGWTRCRAWVFLSWGPLATRRVGLRDGGLRGEDSAEALRHIVAYTQDVSFRRRCGKAFCGSGASFRCVRQDSPCLAFVLHIGAGLKRLLAFRCGRGRCRPHRSRRQRRFCPVAMLGRSTGIARAVKTVHNVLSVE